MSLLLLLRPKYSRSGRRLPITYLRTPPKPKPSRPPTYVDVFLVAESSAVVTITAEVTYNFDAEVEQLLVIGAI